MCPVYTVGVVIRGYNIGARARGRRAHCLEGAAAVCSPCARMGRAIEYVDPSDRARAIVEHEIEAEVQFTRSAERGDGTARIWRFSGPVLA